MSRKKRKSPADKSQGDLSFLSNTPVHPSVPSLQEAMLKESARCMAQASDGIGFGGHDRPITATEILWRNSNRFIFRHNYFGDSKVSFPDNESRPCTMVLKRRTVNHFVYATQRLPGQNDVGMEIYIPTEAGRIQVGQSARFFIKFPEFEGSAYVASDNRTYRYNHGRQRYEVRLPNFDTGEWIPLASSAPLTLADWQALDALRNER